MKETPEHADAPIRAIFAEVNDVPGRDAWGCSSAMGKKVKMENEMPGVEPRRLNVGCGRNAMNGWINLDSQELPGVDIIADLERCAELLRWTPKMRQLAKVEPCP
jgi:hypothetical protein